MISHMHLVEIIIFSLYHDILRPTKIINEHLKDHKILIKVIFQDWKSVVFFFTE